MAGTLTHIKFAHDLYHRLNLPNLDKDFFVIGNQGHDIIYFIKFWEYPKRKKDVSYVKTLQEVDIKEFQNFLSKTDNELKSFFLGYLAHEILDRKVHPYIDNQTLNDDDAHALLESMIDVKINDLETIKTKIPKHLKITKTFKKDLIKIFTTYFKNEVYGEKIVKRINNIYPFLKHYRFDKIGWKRGLYTLINKKKFRFLSFHYQTTELDFSINEFLKLYNEALFEAEVFLKNLVKESN